MAKSLKKNFIFQSAYQILMVISPLITSPYLSRVLGAEKIGIYSYCYSIAYYFAIFAVLGLGNYGNRAISRIYNQGKNKVSQEFWEIYAMQLLCSIIVLILYSIYILFFSGAYQINATIEIFYILSICLDISWFYFGIEEFKTTTIRSFFIKILTILSILIFVKNTNDLNKYTFIMAFGNFASSVILWTQLNKYVIKTSINFNNVMKHFKPNLILFIPVVSLGVFHYMDKVMVGALSTMEELGYYTNADKVINIPLGLSSALGIVMMPRIAKLNEEGNSNSANLYIKDSLIFTIWLGIAMCFGIMAVSKEFVPIFFGEGYDTCVSLLIIFAPALYIKSLSNSIKMQYLIPFGKDYQLNISVIIAAIINIIFNTILIPKYGSMGAVIGTLIAEFSLLIFFLIWSKSKIKISFILFWSLIFILAGIIMYLVVRLIVKFFTKNILKLLFGICIGAFVYCFVTIIVFNVLQWKPYINIQNKIFNLLFSKFNNIK